MRAPIFSRPYLNGYSGWACVLPFLPSDSHGNHVTNAPIGQFEFWRENYLLPVHPFRFRWRDVIFGSTSLPVTSLHLRKYAHCSYRRIKFSFINISNFPVAVKKTLLRLSYIFLHLYNKILMACSHPEYCYKFCTLDNKNQSINQSIMHTVKGNNFHLQYNHKTMIISFLRIFYL